MSCPEAAVLISISNQHKPAKIKQDIGKITLTTLFTEPGPAVDHLISIAICKNFHY